MKMIVGLGNPGEKYNNTRHNVGFEILNNILGKVSWKEKFSALYFEVILDNEKTIYLKPQTYMNASGEAVQKFCAYYNLKPEDILVIQDDIDMEFGKLKIKKTSSSGGHNGIQSIIELTNSDDFCRLKIGVNNSNNKDAKDFVLSNFSKEELNYLHESISVFKDIVELFIKGDILTAMNKYN